MIVTLSFIDRFARLIKSFHSFALLSLVVSSLISTNVLVVLSPPTLPHPLLSLTLPLIIEANFMTLLKTFERLVHRSNRHENTLNSYHQCGGTSSAWNHQIYWFNLLINLFYFSIVSSARSGRTDNLLRERSAISQAERTADVIISYVSHGLFLSD